MSKPELPESFCKLVPAEDLSMLTNQFHALPDTQAQLVLLSLQSAMESQRLTNPVGWMLTVMKKAREGQLFTPRQPSESAAPIPAHRPEQRSWPPETRPASSVSEQSIRSLVRDIRDRLKKID